MSEVHLVHNIPSPYRLHMFRLLASCLKEKGWTFQVHFMSTSHAGRPPDWTLSHSDPGFHYSFHPDHGVRFRKHWFSFNPSIVRRLRREPAKVVILGGVWDSLTCLAYACLPLPTGAVKLAWIEGRQFGKKEGPLRTRMKRSLLGRCNGAVVPGSAAGAFVDGLVRNRQRDFPILTLPNIVDESMFRGRDYDAGKASQEWKASLGFGKRNLAICPARLIPDKGIVPFLERLSGIDLSSWGIAIVGDGPLRAEVASAILRNGLQDSVKLVDPLPYSDMPLVYAASDLFLLPSKFDLNPLSVVEALHSGLPLLVSTRIGNYAEALIEGRNGWSYPYDDSQAALASLVSAFASSDSDRRAMGVVSKSIATRRWDSRRTVQMFVGEMLAMVDGLRRARG